MTINRHTYPYEILFRLAQGGSVQGCHRRDLEIVRDDETGAVYSTKETDPRHIAGPDMDAVLGTINMALVASLSEAEFRADGLSADLAQLQSQHDQVLAEQQNVLLEKDGQIDNLNQAVQDSEAAIAQLRDENQALGELIQQLQQRVAELEESAPVAAAE